ncbi:2-oxo acid dehydrogenase subunit E2 [Cellulomonas sp. ICMP 17802]|uniref:2-oxo acid dehydrogenase subunit E2 n=1 Tax=Cellulomonas sp. ICMP 17802 TaxID=3239199 RepID=UPI00351B44CC
MARPPLSAGSSPGYAVHPVPRERRPVLDRLAGASRRFGVHALVELDVTEPLARLAAAERRVSWTGFVVASVARAVALHPEVNARKAGGTILTFDRVDVGATVERQWRGRAVLDVAVIRDADRRSCGEISDALHRAKLGPAQLPRPTGVTAALLRLPGPLRRTGIRIAGTRPRVAASFGPAVGVTSIGMFTTSWGWAVPLAPLTLIVTVGRVAERPVVRDGAVVVRTLLPLTPSFDHAVIDGAPAARFTETLSAMIESAFALDAEPSA